LDENKSLFSIMIYLLAAHGQGIHALMRFFLNRTSEGTFLPYRCVSVLCLFVACALSTSGQTLSYSTYLSDDQSFPIAALPVAVNATGETCALFVNYRAGAKLRSDASVVYSFSNIPVASSPFGGNTTLVAIDSNGNCYLAGNGVINPTAGAFQSTPKSPPDSPSPFVVKLDETGNISFATYLGGSGTDQGLGITITTATGLTLVAGSTASANFPIVPAPVCADPPMPDPVCTQTGVTSYPYTGETDGFMATFNPSGTKLFNTTYVGGSGGINVVTSVAIDNYEDPELLYVAGYTTSKDFDVVNAAQPTIGGGTDGWVAQILLDLTITSFVPPEGIINTSVGFATYLGGSGTDEITGLTVRRPRT